MAPCRGGALAAAVRVVDRVHRRAARLRADAHVALAAGLADLHVLVVGVADRADGRAALRADHAHLAGRQAQRRHVAVLGHELDRGAGRAPELAAAPSVELDVVDDRADRHVPQRQRVAHRDLGAGPGCDGHADAQAVRREDVALLAVDVMQQRDVRRAVRVVLDRGDLRRHAVLATLEVDLAVQALGPAAAVAGGLAAVRVAPAALLEPLDEALLRLGLRDLREVGVGREAPAGAGGLRSADRHGSLPLEPLQALEDRDLVAGAHLHDRLLPRPRAAGGETAALGLGLHRGGPNLDDAHVEELLDRLADLRLVRVRVDAERVLVVRGEHVALLADDRADDDLARMHGLRGLPVRRGAVDLLALRAGGELGERLLGHEQPRGADEVGDADARRGQHGDARQVAEGQGDPRLLLREHDEHRAAAAPVAEQLRGLARRGLVEARRVEDRQRVALGVHREHAAQRGAALLAVDLDRVVARGRAEDDAAAREVRRTDRALARAAGALLAPRLRATTAHVAARLRRRGALAARVELRADRLVHERAVEARAERRVVEVDALRAAEDLRASHRYAPPRRRCAARARSRGPSRGSAARRRARPRGPSA